MTTALSASLRMTVFTACMLALAGCTVTQTIKNFLSSTTPGSWYTEDGVPKAEYRVHVFVAANLDNLKSDVARGEGEYLASLAELLEVPPGRQPEFFALAQHGYPSLVSQDRAGVTRTLIAMSRDVGGTHPHAN